MLLVHLRGGRVDARHSHGHVVAEPIDCVVGSGGLDWRDGKVCPTRKLRREHPADERCVGRDLVGMHFYRAHKFQTSIVSQWPVWKRQTFTIERTT